MIVKWGKGSAWNPAACVDRPTNPEALEEVLVGLSLMTANLIRVSQKASWHIVSCRLARRRLSPWWC